MSAQTPAHEHPTVWAYVGEGRYLQAAFCRSTADLYAAKFGKATIKSLSNIAAKRGQLRLSKWCRDMGCTWDASLFVSGAEGGSTALLDWLYESGCPLPSEPEDVCDAAAESGCVSTLQWLYDRRIWSEDACITAVRAGKLEAVEYIYTQNNIGSNTFERGPWWSENLCEAACEGGSVAILEWLKEHDCPWNVDRCVEATVEHGNMELVKWFHARELLALDASAVMRAVSHNQLDILDYFCGLGLPFHSNPDLQRSILDYISSEIAGGRPLPLEAISCVVAASLGGLEVLKLLRDAGCPWDEYTLKVARLFLKSQSVIDL